MVKIEISNRAMYFLVTFGIIALFAVGVFAVTGVSHSADELNGVCRSDGVNCPSFQEDWGLYLDGNRLCYPTASSASCSVATATCSLTTTKEIYLYDECDDIAFECGWACENDVACEGDSTPFSCGTTTDVYYDQSSVVSCNDNTGLLICSCSVNQAYQKEVPNNAKCLDDVPTTTTTTTTYTNYQAGLNCKGLGAHDFCVLASCEMNDIDTSPEIGRCYITGSAGTSWQVCSKGGPSGDDAEARAGAYCVDF